jgi:putative NADH-flavin reductase
MKIALIGATGTIGRRILAEALKRGHHVKAIVRDPSHLIDANPNLEKSVADIFEPDTMVAATADQDVVISAYGPPRNQPEDVVRAARTLLDAVKRSGAKRLIVVGGAGSLEVAPGIQLVDTADFPDTWRDLALAHREAWNIYRDSDVNWTYLSPAALIEPGVRTGSYQLGTDKLLFGSDGKSYISDEDFAVALLDEVESPKFQRQRFTVASY